MGGKTTGTASCEDIVVSIQLPGETQNQVNLDVTRQRLDVRSSRYRLSLPMPHPVDPDSSRAEWLDSVLIVTLRMQREFDFVNFWLYNCLMVFNSCIFWECLILEVTKCDMVTFLCKVLLCLAIRITNVIQHIPLYLCIIKTQIAYCPLNTTTFMYFGTVTCFGRFRPSSGYQYSTAN